MSQEPNNQPAAEAVDNDSSTDELDREAGGDGDSPFVGFEDDFLQDMMSGNFIEYASYSIKERAIPHVDDGLKPVQRRILHALHEKDDGRYHKVANIIGHTMQYHPHGDASIGDALVVLANKRYFIDPQGNFGNIFTGDQASAARYIECRLTPLAREVLFNPEITEFIDSYDGRNREPVTLPAKVPALLMLGAEGIAVGMRTRILPHNFGELLKAQIRLLQDKSVKVHPDFPTAGTMDVSEYEDGYGKVKVRARIEIVNDKTLAIREIPYTTTTESLIASIEDAVRKNKIKISSINDYTAERVEVEITLPRGIHAEETRQQLFAYTDCELNLSSQIIVIRDNRPVQVGVSDVLRHTTDRLLAYLKRELEIELGKLHDRFHERSLIRIFIENRIYKRIEECTSYEAVVGEVRAGLAPFRDQLRREIGDQDIEKLLQIQIRRISRFDLDKINDELNDILARIEQAKQALDQLVEYAVSYLKGVLKKFAKEFPRQTEITDLQEVDAREVALRNIRVGHDRQGHFVGSEVRNSNKSEDPLLCSEFDRLVLLKGDGSFKVVPVPEKLYVGAVKYVFVADRNQVYSMVYRDRKTRRHFAKRFRIDRYIMEREYRTVPKGCLVEAIYTNYGVVLRGEFKHKSKGGDEAAEIDFEYVEMRSTTARGFKVSDREVASFTQVRRGSATPLDNGSKKPEAADAPEARPEGEPRKAGKPPPPPSRRKTRKTAAQSPQPPEAAEPAKVAEANAKAGTGSRTGSGAEAKSAESAAQDSPGRPAEAEADPAAVKPAGRLLIDEDTPFFLE